MLQVANVSLHKKEKAIWFFVSYYHMALEQNIDDEKGEEEDWIPTREEIERYVVHLYGKGKSYREIDQSQ